MWRTYRTPEDPLKWRPLGKYSDFVAERLKIVLKQSPRLLPEITQKLAMSLGRKEIAAAQKANWPLALFDVKFATAAIAHSIGYDKVPPELHSLNAKFCPAGEPPVLTYNDLVFVNPQEDMRLFTSGEIGKTERFFFVSHLKCENILAQMIDNVWCDIRGRELAHKVSSRSIVGIVMALGKMPDRHFDTPTPDSPGFRRYLHVIPGSGYQGPSGAYTYRVPSLEIAMWGDWLPRSYQELVNGKMRYFPEEGRAEIGQARTRVADHGSFKDVALASKDSPVAQRLLRLVETMEDFRNVHLTTTIKQIKDAEKATGTSGQQNAAQYLRERVAEMTQLSTRLREQLAA